MKKLILSLLIAIMAIPAAINAQTVTVTTPYFSTSYSNDKDGDYYCPGYHYDRHHHRHHNPHKCKACKKARKAWEKAHKHHHSNKYHNPGHHRPRHHKK